MALSARCPPISPNPYMLGLGIGLELGIGIGLGMGLGIGLGSGFDYFRQYNVIRRIGIRRNGAEPSANSYKMFEAIP